MEANRFEPADASALDQLDRRWRKVMKKYLDTGRHNGRLGSAGWQDVKAKTEATFRPFPAEPQAPSSLASFRSELSEMAPGLIILNEAFSIHFPKSTVHVLPPQITQG